MGAKPLKNVSEKSGSRFVATFCLLYLLGFFAGSGLGVVGPLVGEIASSLGVSVAAIGAELIFLTLPSVLFGAAIGAAVDRFGARRIIVLAVLLLTLADALQFVTSGAVLFGAILLLQGFAISGIFTASQVIVTNALAGEAQTKGLGAWSTVNFVSYAGGLLIAGFAASGHGWRSAYLIHAGLGVASVIATFFLPEVTHAAAAVREGRTSFRGLLKEMGAIRVSLALGLSAIAGVGTNAGVSLYLHNVHHQPLSATASAAALGNIICIPGGLVIGWLLSKGMPAFRLMLAIGVIAIVAGTLIYLPSNSFGGAIAALYAYQLCLSAITALAYAAMPLALADRRQVGAAIGFLLQAGGLGAMAGPTIFFAIMAGGDWRPLVATLIILWLMAAAIFPARPSRTSSRSIAGSVKPSAPAGKD